MNLANQKLFRIPFFILITRSRFTLFIILHPHFNWSQHSQETTHPSIQWCSQPHPNSTLPNAPATRKLSDYRVKAVTDICLKIIFK